MRVTALLSCAATAAILFSGHVVSAPIAFSEKDLLAEIKHQDDLFWRLMKPLAEGVDEGMRIVNKYRPKHGEKFVDWYDGIMDDFAADNEKLYQAAEFAVADNVVLDIWTGMDSLRDHAIRRGWENAANAAREVTVKFAEAIAAKDLEEENFLNPEDGLAFWGEFRRWMLRWREELPFDLNHEIAKLLDSGRMEKNADWTGWMDKLYKQSQAAPRAPVDFVRRNPNDKKFFKSYYAENLLKTFARRVHFAATYDGLVADSGLPVVGLKPKMIRSQTANFVADMALPEEQRAGLLSKLKRFAVLPKPESFPLQHLQHAYLTHHSSRGKETVIADLLRSGMVDGLDGYAGKHGTHVSFHRDERMEPYVRKQRLAAEEEMSQIKLDDQDDGISDVSEHAYAFDNKPSRGFKLKHTAANGIEAKYPYHGIPKNAPDSDGSDISRTSIEDDSESDDEPPSDRKKLMSHTNSLVPDSRKSLGPGEVSHLTEDEAEPAVSEGGEESEAGSWTRRDEHRADGDSPGSSGEMQRDSGARSVAQSDDGSMDDEAEEPDEQITN